MGRTPCCDKTKVKRGPWSPEEDSILKNYLQTHGTGGNWIALPHKAGLKRCGKSCRLRWLNYLRPDIKHGGFTDEEDNIILSLYLNIGSRWSVIASRLQGRTDNDVKNYWNTKMKKKLVAAHAERGNTSTNWNNNSTISPKVELADDIDYDINREYPVINSISTSTTTFSNSMETSSSKENEVSGSSPFSIISWLMEDDVEEEGTSTTQLTTSSFNTVSSSSPSFSLENSDFASWYGVDMGVGYDQGELGFLNSGIDQASSNYSSLLGNYSRNDATEQLVGNYLRNDAAEQLGWYQNVIN